MSQLNLQALGLNLDLDESQVQEGGAKLEPLPAGSYGGRLIGVIEMGQHPGFEGTKTVEKVMLVFQMFGKLVPEVKDKEGNPIPRFEMVRLSKTFGPKSSFLGTFNTMNYEGTNKNFFQLLGKAFKLVKENYTRQDGKPGIRLHHTGIKSPLIEVMDDDGMPTGEFRSMKVPEATAPLQVFQWASGNQAQFDTLPYWVQKEIKNATNIANGPAQDLVMKENPKGGKEDQEEAPVAPQVAPKPATRVAAQSEGEFEF